MLNIGAKPVAVIATIPEEFLDPLIVSVGDNVSLLSHEGLT